MPYCVPRMTTFVVDPKNWTAEITTERQSREGENDATQAEEPHGAVQGPGGPGGAQRGQDGQRVGGAAPGPPHPDPRLEEAAPGLGRGGLLAGRRRQGGGRGRERGAGEA